MLAVFSPVAARRRVALRFEGSLDQEVRADPQKLRQALDNLVANALKFTPRGGQVRVRVSRQNEETVFEIADSGPGIPQAEREAIFDRYKQGMRGRAAGGAGLGLAIARGIAEAHHGSISVGSSEEGGAAFRIVLPG
jgi:signal transduction histidine kinase